MCKNNNILFVSHESSATGAPIVFLNTINKLKQNILNFKLYLVIVKKGALDDAFRSVTNNIWYVHEDPPINWPDFKLVYFNSIESSHLFDDLKLRGYIKKGTKIILHSHEMYGTVHKYGLEKSRLLVDKADHVFCASETVFNNLISIGYNENCCTVVRPLILMPKQKKAEKSEIIMACGEISFNKGIDYFIQVARLYFKKNPNSNLKFYWVGPDTRGLKALIEWDLSILNLKERVIFTGYSSDVMSYFSKSKLFILPSRQDSFPLVVLEALSVGLPILYFKETGGVSSILDERFSIAINYMDIEDGVTKIEMYLKYDSTEEMQKYAISSYGIYVKKMNKDFEYVMKVVNNLLGES